MLGEDGKPLKELPPSSIVPLIKVSDAPSMIKAERPVITDVPSAVEMRQIQVMESFKQLEPDDIRMSGVPKVEVVRDEEKLDF